MRLWMVYERENVQRNLFFIRKWEQAALARGLEFHVVTTCDISFGISAQRPFVSANAAKELPDLVVMRTNQPLLTRQFEMMGIPVFNSYQVASVCNDKQMTHQLALGIAPMMDTAFISQDAFYCPFPYPVVVKASHGCGGRQVVLAADESAFLAALRSVAPDSAVVQPLCDTPGRDLRVYMLGKQVVKTMLRISHDDFRSNLGLGGETSPVDLDPEAGRIAGSFADVFDFGLVGVDFIYHRGKLMFNEIEDAVGTRMLYAHTQMDIAALYLEFILAKVL